MGNSSLLPLPEEGSTSLGGVAFCPTLPSTLSHAHHTHTTHTPLSPSHYTHTHHPTHLHTHAFSHTLHTHPPTTHTHTHTHTPPPSTTPTARTALYLHARTHCTTFPLCRTCTHTHTHFFFTHLYFTPHFCKKRRKEKKQERHWLRFLLSVLHNVTTIFISVKRENVKGKALCFTLHRFALEASGSMAWHGWRVPAHACLPGWDELPPHYLHALFPCPSFLSRHKKRWAVWFL